MVISCHRQRLGADEIVLAQGDDIVRGAERGVDLRQRAGERHGRGALPEIATPWPAATVNVPCATVDVVVSRPEPASTSATNGS